MKKMKQIAVAQIKCQVFLRHSKAEIGAGSEICCPQLKINILVHDCLFYAPHRKNCFQHIGRHNSKAHAIYLMFRNRSLYLICVGMRTYISAFPHNMKLLNRSARVMNRIGRLETLNQCQAGQ